MKKSKIETSVPQQIRRMRAVVNHVEHMEPAMREYLLARLAAKECSPQTNRWLRVAGYR